MNDLKRYTIYIVNCLDLMALGIAWVCSYIIVFYFLPDHAERYALIYNEYSTLFIEIILSYVIVDVFFLYGDENYFARSDLEELGFSAKMTIDIFAILLIILFATRTTLHFSRLFVGCFFMLFLITDYLIRKMAKKRLFRSIRIGKFANRVIIIGDYDDVLRMEKNIKEHQDWRYNIVGLLFTDHAETKYKGPERILSRSDFSVGSSGLSYDSVILLPDHSMEDEEVTSYIRFFQSMGKTVDVNIPVYPVSSSFYDINQIGSMPCMTYSGIRPMAKRKALSKRFLDVIFSLIGIPFFCFVYMFVTIINVFTSHGPVLTRHFRLGKNGIGFYAYRFRIYSMDSERGKAVMSPAGKILTFFHLDGFPEMWNVFFGDMSLFGPAALTLAQYFSDPLQYKESLLIKPGVFGYWSFLEDPFQIRHREKEYLYDWSITRDFLICSDIFLHFLLKHSLRPFTHIYQEEQIEFIGTIKNEYLPYVYDYSAYTETQTVRKRCYYFFKRAADIIFSLVGIIILFPLMVVLSVLIIANDDGFPIYGHVRIGKHGKKIRVLKFRSMRTNSDDLKHFLTKEQYEQYQKEFKIDNDPRITKIGKFLRSSSMDELPQLFNILKGDMSLIGPRPITEQEMKFYGKDVAKLLSVTPGLTGYWQAYSRNESMYEDGTRQAMEMYYIDHQGVSLDIRVFFRTFGRVFSRKGAK